MTTCTFRSLVLSVALGAIVALGGRAHAQIRRPLPTTAEHRLIAAELRSILDQRTAATVVGTFSFVSALAGGALIVAAIAASTGCGFGPCELGGELAIGSSIGFGVAAVLLAIAIGLQVDAGSRQGALTDRFGPEWTLAPGPGEVGLALELRL